MSRESRIAAAAVALAAVFLVLPAPASAQDACKSLAAGPAFPNTVVTAAQDVAALAHHRPGALLAGQAGALLDPVERRLGRALEHRKHRRFAEAIDAVVAPFAGRNHAAIEGKQADELSTLEEDDLLTR